MAGPKPTVSDERILRLVVLYPAPAVKVGDLVDPLGITEQAVNKRLKGLVDDGLLDTRKVGARARVYWPTEEGRRLAWESARS